MEKLEELKLMRYNLVSAEPTADIPEIRKLTESEIAKLKNMNITVEGLFQNIEPETKKIAEAYAEFYIKRYEKEAKNLMKEDPEKFEYFVRKGRYNSDGTLPEKRREDQRRMGITQKAFEIALQQLQVPYIPNDPTIDWRPKDKLEDPTDHTTKFSYDFYIPFMGNIDIKSSIWYNPFVNINCREFEKEKPDMVVAYHILKDWKYLKLSGFLMREQVESYEPLGQGDYRDYWHIPIEDFDKEEHNGVELCYRLLTVRKKVKVFQQIDRVTALSQ